jgi:hypothetical protein
MEANQTKIDWAAALRNPTASAELSRKFLKSSGAARYRVAEEIVHETDKRFTSLAQALKFRKKLELKMKKEPDILYVKLRIVPYFC